MRVVLDTNTLVSAILSPLGPPRRLLDDARAQVFELCSSPVLMAELLDNGIPIVTPAQAVQLVAR